MKNKTTIGKWALATVALLTLNLGSLAQDAYTVAGVAGQSTQDISKLPKMERDIIILQNVLNDLFNEGNRFYSSSRGAKGIYVPGKGVIFNMGSSSRSSYDVIFAEQVAIQNVEREEKTEQTTEEKNKEREDKIKSVSKDFLVNYGSILSDLKPGEKVMLNVNYSALREPTKSSQNGLTIQGGANVIYRGGSRTEKKRLVSSIDFSTITSYLNGKTSLQSASSAVSQNIIESTTSTVPDAKIMAGILDDLFQSNFDGIYRRSGKTNWTYFEGFGLMFDLNLTGARSGVRFLSADAVTVTGRRAPENDNTNKKLEEDNKKIEESFDDLIELVKESLVTYGRTLRSVKSDEVVILNLNFGSSFRKTKLPRALRLQVTKSQIEAYSKGQKSIEQLKKEIDITNLRASTSNFSHSDFPEAVIYETAPEHDDHPLEIVGHTRPTGKKSN
ncbi:hypothetical protein [Roseivirga sp. E12]|uniref:hypothetical protein n=1 Tax=Roseivirga sp. E12 TaxID=2819237 RepID=UPI001ABCDEE6|nr:hypothetical protein [Roseivirga sp. E12]MBO3700634.1 hypothetical protein [Roseivirga sp. E12]